MTFGSKRLGINMTGKDYSLNIELNVIKPRVWHCDEGTQKMGIDNNWTYYCNTFATYGGEGCTLTA